MAFNQVTATSLTPSRPAPQIPIRQVSISSASTAFSSSSSVTLTPPKYGTSYSGIGGTPNIGGFPKRSSDGAGTSGVIRQGPAGFKEDAFASWIWREKWLVLKEQTLSVHKNEVSSRPWPVWFSSSCIGVFRSRCQPLILRFLCYCLRSSGILALPSSTCTTPESRLVT